MTVCIGALCGAVNDRAQAVVLASDRMVTMGGFIEFEHEVAKGIGLGQKAIALIAGDALRGSRLARDVQAHIPAEGITSHELARVASQRYAELRQEQVQTEIFAPRGMYVQQFYAGQQQQLLPQLSASIDQQVIAFNFGVECLLAGVDDTGAHLYLIVNPGGSFTDFEQIGFAAVGSGAIHAVQSLIGDRHTPAQSLNQTLFAVYSSKRRGEVAPGVGYDTDLWIIDEAGLTRVRQSLIDDLAELYNVTQQPMQDELRRKVEDLQISNKEG